MSAQRIRRAERLVEVRARAVDTALGALGMAMAATRDAEAAAAVSERRWSAALTRAALAVGSVADVGAVHAYVHSLRVEADRAHAAVSAAKVLEEARRGEVTVARIEHRKVELWRDGMAATLQAHADRLERRAADETAARSVRRT